MTISNVSNFLSDPSLDISWANLQKTKSAGINISNDDEIQTDWKNVRNIKDFKDFLKNHKDEGL